MSDPTRRRLADLIELLMDAYPQGLTTPEAATLLDVSRQTIHHDLQRLEEDRVPVLEVERHRYAINPRDYIRPLRLTLPQAWMLYLPLRRMVRAQLHDHQVVYSLLQRLTAAFDPIIGDQLLPDHAVNQSREAETFIHLVEAWRDHQLVAIHYRPLNKPSSRHLIAPYWFEPSVWSDSLYIIAGLHDHGQPGQAITLKLDRVDSATIRPDRFDPPAPEDILTQLSDTWGIWGGESPMTVRLRFHNRQQQRLQETRWHPSEQITVQDDGSVIWQATISEPQEMVPWIRGWGADIEVLAPESLRQQVALEAERMAALYGSGEQTRFLGMRRPKDD